MEIRINGHVDSVPRVQNAPPKASRPVDSEHEVSTFDSSHALEARLQQIADVRSQNVEAAKQKIADPMYPPRETIQRIAALLAIKDTQTGDDSTK